jgi:hypothetical protein
MTKTDYLKFISVLFCVAIIFAMAYTKNVNVIGLAVLLVGIYYFSNKNGVDSIFIKLSMGIIAFVVAISLFGYFFSTRTEMSEYGKNLLKSVVNLSSTTRPASIPANEIAKPGSPKYTYAFSVYLTNVPGASSNAADNYIFYRRDDDVPSALNYSYINVQTPNAHGRNIGLRFGNTGITGKNDFATLYLDYATKKTGTNTTAFYTRPIYSNFPTKTWMDIVISVDKNVINVYIDGKELTKQISDPNLKAPSASKEIEFGFMDAHLANLYHLPDVLKPTQNLLEYLSKVDGISV